MAIFRTIVSIMDSLKYRIFSYDARLLILFLRSKGVKIGVKTEFYGKMNIDLTRPCLVEIGNNCIITNNFTLLTHGYDWAVLKKKYNQVLSSSGKVVIEDNVFIGNNVTILKGVRIGHDSIIGANSIVTKNIPSGSVAAGNPCQVIMSIEEYYEKRKRLYVEEAKAYAYELYIKTGKVPERKLFGEERSIFSAVNDDSKRVYNSFEEFLIASGIPAEKVKPI